MATRKFNVIFVPPYSNLAAPHVSFAFLHLIAGKGAVEDGFDIPQASPTSGGDPYSSASSAASATCSPPSGHQAVRFETLVLTSKPNQYLVCPPDLCTEAKAHQESPQFDRTADDLRAAFETVVLGSEAVTKIAESEDTLDVVARTPFVRWPDWVTIRFIPLGENRSTLAIYSRSVYGSSDFGANKRRITNWLARLSAQP